MTFVEAIKSVFTQYANFNGRARRSEYWYFTLCNFVIAGVLNRLGSVSLIFSILSFIYGLAVLVPAIAVCVRRLHDIGKKGIWLLLVLIPLVGAIILIVWYCKDSDPGANEFGPNPKGM